MSRWKRLVAVLTVAGVVAVGCGDDDDLEPEPLPEVPGEEDPAEGDE